MPGAVSVGALSFTDTQALNIGTAVENGRLTAGGGTSAPLYVFNNASTVTINSRGIQVRPRDRQEPLLTYPV